MLIDEIKKQVIVAMKAKDTARRDILKVALGDIQMGETRKGKPLTDDEAAAIIKKIIKGSEETIAATDDQALITKLKEENQILGSFLPQTLDVPAIIQALDAVADAIKSAGNNGAAIGIAMKHLKSNGAAVEGKDVAQAVNQIRA